MRRVTAKNYNKDKYYPRVAQAVTAILKAGDVFHVMCLFRCLFGAEAPLFP